MTTVVIYCGPGMGEVLSGPGFRSCAHAGCAWPASATLSFDYETRRTWLDDLAGANPATYDLCSVHADRFRPPKGWESDDRRRLPEPVIEPAEAPENLPFEQIQIEGGQAKSLAAEAEPSRRRVALPEI